MSDPYIGREQTGAKHFILRRYLQALAFKVLTFSDVAYIDGFSGPWETKTENFSDSSFMIAIRVLLDAQMHFLERGGPRRRIKCFFSENDPEAYAQLDNAVREFHRPTEGFEIKTYQGKFEDAVTNILSFIGNSFPLIFIDPTGWTGYPLDKIKPLFARTKCEALVNFMYDFINRFSHSEDTEIIESLAPILGGGDWPSRIDQDLPRGLAVEKLFRETLKSSGGFKFVVSTRIDKATAERPHFFIVYGTKSEDGLKAFRQTEYAALREHAKNRANALERQRESRLRASDLFSGYQAQLEEATIDEILSEQKALAKARLLELLSERGPMEFSQLIGALLEPFMLRETNVKDLCVDLAKNGKIENTWGGGNRKPSARNAIKLRTG